MDQFWSIFDQFWLIFDIIGQKVFKNWLGLPERHELFPGLTFTLPSFENLSPEESVEKIAEHFSKISREFPPIEAKNLPDRVQKKLKYTENESKIPRIFEYEVFKENSSYK